MPELIDLVWTACSRCRFCQSTATVEGRESRRHCCATPSSWPRRWTCRWWGSTARASSLPWPWPNWVWSLSTTSSTTPTGRRTSTRPRSTPRTPTTRLLPTSKDSTEHLAESRGEPTNALPAAADTNKPSHFSQTQSSLVAEWIFTIFTLVTCIRINEKQKNVFKILFIKNMPILSHPNR